MKKVIVLFLVFFTSIVFAENTIIAIINNTPITLNSLQNKFFNSASYNEKIEKLNERINTILQLQKASEFNLKPKAKDVETVLIDVAKNNNISIDDLLSFDDIDDIKNEILEKLSILNLQRYITQDIEHPQVKILSECKDTNFIKDTKQIKVAQIIISEINSDANDPEQKNKLIKSFLKKLSNHISKGASFEAFAKLHSQHPSYKNGGVTDWLTVNNPTLEMLDSLDKNKVSEIYSTAFGLAIAIKIDEQFISSKLVACEEQVIYKNAENYYAQWLEHLREQAFIEIYYDKL